MEFCLHVHLCTLCELCIQRPEESVKSSSTGVTDSCWSLCGWWDLDLYPLEEQPVLLCSEPSLHPCGETFNYNFNLMACYDTVYIIYTFLLFGSLCVFKNLSMYSHFFLPFIKVSKYSLMSFWTLWKSVVNLPFHL